MKERKSTHFRAINKGKDLNALLSQIVGEKSFPSDLTQSFHFSGKKISKTHNRLFLSCHLEIQTKVES